MTLNPEDERQLKRLLTGEVSETDPSMAQRLKQNAALASAWREVRAVQAELGEVVAAARSDEADAESMQATEREEQTLDGFRQQIGSVRPAAMVTTQAPSAGRRLDWRLPLLAAAALLVAMVFLFRERESTPESDRQLNGAQGAFVQSPGSPFGTATWNAAPWAFSYDVEVWSENDASLPLAAMTELTSTRWTIPSSKLPSDVSALRWLLVLRDASGAELGRDTWLQQRR